MVGGRVSVGVCVYERWHDAFGCGIGCVPGRVLFCADYCGDIDFGGRTGISSCAEVDGLGTVAVFEVYNEWDVV